MLNRFAKTVTTPSRARLFSTTFHNANALTSLPLIKILREYPRFPTILAAQQKKGHFLDKKPVDYGMSDFIQKYIEDPKLLELSATALLCQVPTSETIQWLTRTDKTTLPLELLDYTSLNQTYVELLMDVYTNRQSLANYDNSLSPAENLTERAHSRQSAVLASRLFKKNAQLTKLVTAMLEHDVRRVTTSDQTVADRDHHTKGDDIQGPLGVPRVSLCHGYAKANAREHCASFPQLISPLSEYTLAIQAKNLQPVIEYLEALSSEELAEADVLFVFCRIAFDDCAKVPESKLATVFGKNFADFAYLSDDVVKQMLFKQLHEHSHELMVSARLQGNVEEVAATQVRKLDKGVRILAQAAPLSNNPEIYEEYTHPVMRFKR